MVKYVYGIIVILKTNQKEDFIMICKNEMCIFQEANECLKETIELDCHGNCKNTIYPCIPKDFVDFYKSNTRKTLELDTK